MTGRNLVAQFVLRLTDRASAGLMRLQQRIQSLSAAARRVALIGGALAGLSVAGPVREAAALEGQMRQMGITAGLAGAELEAFQRRNLTSFQQWARVTNQRVQDLSAAAGVLVAGGGRAGEVWEELVPIIGRVATASGARAEDLSQSVLAMVNNLRLAPGEVEQALATLVQAGKEGQFELRDMAREFAGLTAAAAGIGMTGPRAIASLAAALQIARRGAATAGEAANNLQNTLQKMTSEDAVKAFRDMGVNIQAVLGDAARRGINPMEALIQKIREITGGDMFRVQQLFADSQVLGFLRPMIQQTAEFMAIRDRAGQTPVSVISTDQESAMRGLSAALQRVTIRVDEFTARLGLAAEGPLRRLGDGLEWLSDRLTALDERFPGLVDNTALALAAFFLLAAGLGILGMAIGPIAAGLGAIKVAAAALLSPFVLAGLVIAGTALYIWQEWERFREGFATLGDGVRRIAQGLTEYFLGIFTLDAARSVEGLKLLWSGIEPFFSGLWTIVQTLFSDFAGWLDSWTGGAVTAAVAQFRGAWDGMGEWFSGLIAAIRAPFDTFIGGVTAGIERIQQLWQGVRDRFAGGQAAEGAPPALGAVQGRQATARAGLGGGFYPPELLAGAANANAPVTGEIVVRAAPGSEVVSAEGTNRNVPVTAAPDRGATRGRR